MKENYELTSPINEKYRKFFDSFKEIETKEVKDWKAQHLIGLFCKLYKEHYKTDYKFKFNSPSPSKCYEVFQIKKLAQLLTSDPVKLKQYIEWAFSEKVKMAKKRITSIAFLSHDFMTTEYKLKYLSGDLASQRLDRTTTLPIEYKEIINSYGHRINNYGELSFLLQIGGQEDLVNKLHSAGMDIEAVKRIV